MVALLSQVAFALALETPTVRGVDRNLASREHRIGGGDPMSASSKVRPPGARKTAASYVMRLYERRRRLPTSATTCMRFCLRRIPSGSCSRRDAFSCRRRSDRGSDEAPGG